MRITVETPIEQTPRVAQIQGMFDLPPEKFSRLSWDVELPLDQQSWSIGLIVGPSGCGKSTLARQLWPEVVGLVESLCWHPGQSVVDDFPAALSIKTIAELLSAVGFSSPPAWLRPFQVLSTGQQFRVTLARLLAHALTTQPAPLLVFDEYTSVVDRTVARVGSAAVAKAIRAHALQFVAVTCHDDVEDWLNPDWVYRPAENQFTWRCLRCRPPVQLDIVHCQAQAWPLFAPHHYLSQRLNPSAVCFLASWLGRPVGFSAWLPFVGAGPPTRREHRTVVLPDYQGVGMGNALSATIAAMWRGLGYRAISTTTHPALIRSRSRSSCWRMHRRPSFAAGHEGKLRHATTRLTAGFEYVGPPLHPRLARALHGN
ncbi:MAG: GNAT family N-acetyltransferase [Gemmataceae bacterium]